MTRFFIPLLILAACSTDTRVTAVYDIPDDVTYPRAYAQGLCPGDFMIRYTPALEVVCYE